MRSVCEQRRNKLIADKLRFLTGLNDEETNNLEIGKESSGIKEEEEVSPTKSEIGTELENGSRAMTLESALASLNHRTREPKLSS